MIPTPEEVEALVQELREAFTASGSYLPSYYDEAAWILTRFVRREKHERLLAHIESSHNEVTCSQDARHANDGDDRVPMLTCMTLEAHTLRAENTKLRERVEKLRTAACALVGEARALVWDEPPDRVIPTSLRVGSVRQLRAALAACEEDGT